MPHDQTTSLSKPVASRRRLKPLAVFGCFALVLLGGILALLVRPETEQSQATTSIPGYHIMVSERLEDWNSYYVTTFEVIRNDGWTYAWTIDSAANRGQGSPCGQLSIERVAAKIYFRCINEQLTAATPYVDSERRVVFFGRNWADEGETSITDLPFHPPR